METDELKGMAEGVACKGDAWMGELRVARGKVERSIVTLRIVLENLERDAEDGELPYAAEQVVDDLMEGILETLEPRSFTRRAEKLEREISEAEREDDDEWYPPTEVQQRMRGLADGLRAHAELVRALGKLEERLKEYVNPKGEKI
jgi:hypothetical protein